LLKKGAKTAHMGGSEMNTALSLAIDLMIFVTQQYKLFKSPARYIDTAG